MARCWIIWARWPSAIRGRSISFAAELATLAPKLRVGHLGATRVDNVAVNLHTQQVVNVAIDRQPLLHFASR